MSIQEITEMRFEETADGRVKGVSNILPGVEVIEDDWIHAYARLDTAHLLADPDLLYRQQVAMAEAVWSA